MIFFRELTVQESASITCDRCGRRAENESTDFEFEEFLSIDHACGYGSIIGDGTRLHRSLPALRQGVVMHLCKDQ